MNRKTVKIEIDTDGSREGTVVIVDGNRYENLVEFCISLKPGRRSKPKMQMVTHIKGQGNIPLSFFAGDFEKFNKNAPEPESFIGCDRKE